MWQGYVYVYTPIAFKYKTDHYPLVLSVHVVSFFLQPLRINHLVSLLRMNVPIIMAMKAIRILFETTLKATNALKINPLA